MKWRTSISTHKNGELYVHGKKLLDLIQEHSFVQGIFLLLKGVLPNNKEEELLNTLLVAMIEHGIQAPSTFVSRTVASTGNPVNAALAGGILSIGEFHGGAIEQCAKYFQSGKTAQEIVTEITSKGGRMPGYGHKIYKDSDPRTAVIFKKAAQLGFKNTFIALAEAIQKELKKQTGKKLPINIDGAVAALMSELGLDWQLGKALFILGRLPGLIAHVHEEMVREKPYRRLEEADVEYDGVNLGS